MEGVRLEGISFAAGDPSLALAEAREAAVADARRKAGHFADLAGVALGAVTSIVEVTGSAARNRCPS